MLFVFLILVFVVLLVYILYVLYIPQKPSISFDNGATEESYPFIWDCMTSEYLTKLRTEFDLDLVSSAASSDLNKVRAISHWLHSKMKRSMWRRSQAADPLLILLEAKRGQRFRCVEYGVALSGCLNAVGISARTLGLLKHDVETRLFGSGHVATEAFLPDMDKWVFIDPMFDAIPVVNGIPLNAAEFALAIARKEKNLKILTSANITKRMYLVIVKKYLFYLYAPLDNRGEKIGSKTRHLMLAPLAKEKPKVFERKKNRFNNMSWTNSVRAFYPDPTDVLGNHYPSKKLDGR